MTGEGKQVLYVFDCFGTLVNDSRELPQPADLIEALKCHRAVPDDCIDCYVAKVYERLARVLFDPETAAESTVTSLLQTAADLDLKVSGETVGKVLWTLCGVPETRFSLTPGARDLLNLIREKGHAIRMLSNCLLPGPLMDHILSRLGILAYFERRSYSSDGQVKKPDLRAFRNIASGSFVECWMIGDSIVFDLTPAQELGWKVASARDRLPSPAEIGL
jgi:FMN phosphatase YigB (HAD superfamily)